MGEQTHPEDSDVREQSALEHVKEVLNEDTDHDPEDVEKAVDEALHKYDDAEVRDFVPILVEREARERLRE